MYRIHLSPTPSPFHARACRRTRDPELPQGRARTLSGFRHYQGTAQQ